MKPALLSLPFNHWYYPKPWAAAGTATFRHEHVLWTTIHITRRLPLQLRIFDSHNEINGYNKPKHRLKPGTDPLHTTPHVFQPLYPLSNLWDAIGAHLGLPLKAGRMCFRITELFGISSPWNLELHEFSRNSRRHGIGHLRSQPKSSKPKIKEAAKNLQRWLPWVVQASLVAIKHGHGAFRQLHHDMTWISKTLGSRKGHPQIWEGPIAYHAFAQKCKTWGASLARNFNDLLDSRVEAVLPFWSGIFAAGLWAI